MKNFFSTLLLLIAFANIATAQEPRVQKEIRYVTKNGRYDNSGESWAEAKNNVQDAINDLVNKGLTGEVWVARGVYTPTESTESSGGSTLYMSFKVPAGITVRGGFFGPGAVPNGVEGSTSDSLYYFRELMFEHCQDIGIIKKDDNTNTNIKPTQKTDIEPGDWFPGEENIDQRAIYQSTRNNITQDKSYPYRSILSGDLSQPAGFEWNEVKDYWSTSFYGNCYHVVWFATEGFDGNGRAKPLNTTLGEAVVEGFTIMNGNARNNDLASRAHNAYGGGVYMVQGSRLENCNVQQCEASRDGGGIYMDGGGVVRHCYINNCQALGIGAQNGYGGGVMLETNKSVTTSLMGMYQSVVNGCAARFGGGVAIKTENTVNPDGKDLRYQVFLSASAIYNNTATTEAGGLYMDGGGAISNITITRNRCNGTGIISNGMATGRAGGLYCRDHAVVLNSVLWGNECSANNNLQFASSQSASSNDLKVDMRYCAVAYADFTDWSFTAKEGVFNLSNYNTIHDAPAGSVADKDVYPHFNNPTPVAGYVDTKPTTDGTQSQTQLGLHRYYDWQPATNSGLANAGIIALDLNINGDLPFNSLYKDVLGNDYNPRVTLGGYTRKFGTMTATQRIDKNGDGSEENYPDEYHFFVDPEGHETRQLSDAIHGESWDQPARFLSNVLYSIYNHPDKASLYDRAGVKTYIHVKEGTVNNTNSYVNTKRVREMTIGVRSDNLVILGGYPAELTGTSLKQTTAPDADGNTKVYERNPLRTPTFISGVITGENDYDMNAAHLMQFDDCENVEFDGFQIRDANASSSLFDNSGNDGGAIRLINGAKNITFRNLIIAGNTADRGAAVFAEDGTQATFENCIIHNNESKKATRNTVRQGIIHTLGNAELTFNHCDILNNVGHPGYLEETSQQRYANSIFFANASEASAEAYGDETAALALSSFAGDNAPLATGEARGVKAFNSLFDAASGSLATALGTTNSFTLSYTLNGEGFPRFINGVHNIGRSIGGDETYYGRSTSFEPHNNNPMVNSAKTVPTDFYNGLTHTVDNSTWGTTDLSTRITRNYGGLPDIGAIENHASTTEEAGENAYPGGQAAMGDVIYVKTYEDGGRDTNGGTSWDDALTTVQKAIEMAYYPDGKQATTTTTITHDFAANTALTTLTEIRNAGWVRINSVKHSNYFWYRNNTTIAGTNGSGVATYFMFEPVEGESNLFYIKAYNGNYITGNVRRNTSMTTSANGTKQTFELRQSQFGGFYIVNTSSTDATYNSVNAYSSTSFQGWTPSDQGSSWTIRNVAAFTYDEVVSAGHINPQNKEVWVAKGVYTSKSDDDSHPLKNSFADPEGSGNGRCHKQKFSIMLREGVNVYGGFSNEGYPGMDDRNPKLYETIIQPGDPLASVTQAEIEDFNARGIDGTFPLEYRANSENCGSFGRVVVQEKDFDIETKLDGFTVTNGFLNTTSQTNIVGKLYDIMDKSNNQVGLTGGAGVYLLKNGVIENCVVKGNMTYSNPEGASSDPVTAETSNKTYQAFGSDGGFHTVAAGVYNKGGKVVNSQISNNMILFELMHEGVNYDDENPNLKRSQAAWLYGAGLFQESGTTYNTIIHDNKQKITNFKVRTGYENSGYGGYDDPYSDEGKLHNEFWPREYNTSAQGDTRSSHQSAAGTGVFLVSGEFYNNTVTNNTYRFWPQYVVCQTMIGIGGVYAFDDATIYNCIITNNEPATIKDAGLEHPFSPGTFLRAGKSGDNYASYYNFPIICFDTSEGATNYTPAPQNITVRYSAIDYKCAVDAWPESVVLPVSISNQCLTNDLNVSDNNESYFFSAENSYGYADNNAECNFTGTGYASGSGTNWYGMREGNTTYSELISYDEEDKYKITSSSPAMNNGTNYIPNAELPDYDAEYTDRIKDCTVDMGAYEFSDSYAITPKVMYKEEGGVQVVDESKAATFYVTPLGRGLASGSDPDNAACAAKLQRVLDAAGRYKYQHPGQQVIVKVASSTTTSNFKYYATRTTDESDANVRVWSIIVPRGVEVWGGYTDNIDNNNNNNNGFYENTVVDGVVTSTKDVRNITENQTNFDSYYYSSEIDGGVNCYHVITFTDRIFDGNGKPYMVGDKIGEASSYVEGSVFSAATPMNEPATASALTYLLMSDDYTHEGSNNSTWGSVTDRAVIDGIYITGGQADLQTVSSGSQTLNINRYGGAAIVTDFAHVRNCILRGNQSIYGGALALTHNALVSGCLIEQNTADYGGAIYVFEHGSMLSDGTEIKTSNNPDDYVTDGTTGENEGKYDPNSTALETSWDYKMPHVYASTIVNNEAKNQGGGVWYCTNHANVRFNSTLVWANSCPDQPNVSGLYNITRPERETYVTTEYYPFNYCAVQDIRPSGLNNISVDDRNNRGVRFHDDENDPDYLNRNQMAKENTDATGFDKYAAFGHYGLTNYSVLNRSGMPVSEWKELNTTRQLGLSDTDFTSESRFVISENSAVRTNIEIGARAFDKHFPNTELMLRLFVAKSEDVDIDAVAAVLDAGSGVSETDPNREIKEYYAQEGSSFAYPMTKLQDALDYITTMRGLTVSSTTGKHIVGTVKHNANDMPFEIYIGPGTFYPSADLTGNNKNSVGNTFIIPEGVSLIGGHNPTVAADKDGNRLTSSSTDKHFLGRHRLPNYKTPDAGNWDANAYYVDGNTKTPTAAESEPYVVTTDAVTYTIHHVDKDLCSSIRKLNDINANSIIEPWEFDNQTILSGQIEGVTNNGVNHIVTIHADENYVGALPHTQGAARSEFKDNVYEPVERGQIIAFDGLTFIGGYAHGYQAATLDDAHKLKYCYGGAIYIDTNQYYNDYNKNKRATPDAGIIADNDKHGYMRISSPAAVGYREVPVMINRCKFENNTAGLGGAVAGNTTVDIMNSSFEHNMAKSGEDTNVDYTLSNGTKESFTVSYPGLGGAVYGTYQVAAVNCLFANNEALDESYTVGGKKYAVLTSSINARENGNTAESVMHTINGGSGGAIMVSQQGHFHVMNCNFVRNQANAYPAIYTLNPNSGIDAIPTTTQKQYNQALNSVFWGNAINERMKAVYTAEQLFAADKIVNYGDATRLDADYYQGVFLTGEPTPYTQADLDDESLFAEQVWFSAYEEGKGKTPKNNHDLRDTDFNPYTPIKTIITNAAAANGHAYQNCNVKLSEENAVNEGPNFVNPSTRPGYEGYMESADWSPSRINSLTDAGWGRIKQVIEELTYEAEFVKYDGTEYPVPADRASYSGETIGDYVTWGAYTTMRYLKGNEKYNKTMPLGEQEYMYTTYNGEDGNPINLYRISYDPNPSHDQTYIDMGVYEYYHAQLQYDTEGDEVDIIWVSPLEKPDNGLPDGSDWSQPTSDLQRAIETLLASRNGRRKEIRLMNGTFTPIYTMTAADGNTEYLSYYINTKSLNSAVTKTENGKGIMSLTIKGGYSHELNNVREVSEYPAIIRQQRRTDNSDTNNRWNHLFLIDDPTQRYGMDSYEAGSDYGHWANDDTEHNTIHTFPIQFDGVTLINDQAAENTEGAVIHYTDLQALAESGVNSNATPSKTITPTATNVTTRYASAIDHDYDVIANPAKLIISKSKIIGSGTHNYDNIAGKDRSSSSAVYIGTNGGHALLYNNVMHSNYGKPLVAMCETRTVNNTFALNGGLVDLGDGTSAGSYIRNSVLWRNNEKATDKPQFALSGYTSDAASGAIFSYNAYTGGNTEATDYKNGSTISGNHYNVGLKDENDDIIRGPHFIDPLNADLEARNFSLRPSLRLLHKGSDQLYDTLAVEKNTVSGKMEIDETKAYTIYDLAYEPSFGIDAADKQRFVNTIDLGAYEYQNMLNRVLYVDPQTGHDDSHDGMAWDPQKVFGHGALQNAIDLAGLYYHTNQEEAYVFVKGGNTSKIDLHTAESLVLRDGVSIYGGINPGFREECGFTTNENKERIYDDEVLKAYVKTVQDDNEGYLGPNTHKVIVSGIKTDPYTTYNENNPDVYTLIDGFYVSATMEKENTAGIITEPVIDIAPQSPNAKVILRDIVVFGNDISATPGKNVANLKNALIYEALFRDNKTHDNNTADNFTDDAAVLSLDEGAWAVSITAEGRTTTKPTGEADYVSPYNGYGNDDNHRTAEIKNRIVNSIVNYDKQDPAFITDTTLTAQTKYTLSGHNYRRTDHNMYYQLTEGSKHINEIGIAKNQNGNEFLSENGFGHWTQFVDYRNDRDLLGNKRLLTLKDLAEGDVNDQYLDRGAFETWKVEKDTRTAEAGHFNPHTGSVVYLMEGVNLVCGIDLVPGFLLLKKGASLYGNGHSVRSSFISVERMIDPDGNVMSLPFEMDYSEGQSFSDGVGKTTYKDATDEDKTEVKGELILTPDPDAQILLYNGTDRSAWNYEFRDVSSENWRVPTTTIVPANQGVFFRPSGISKPTLYAFTSMGELWNDNVYVEEPTEMYKEIELTQYDDREATADNNGNTGADFTSQENMGWNCIGLPYLVSNYKTHEHDYAITAGAATSEYNMHLPHTLWLYYDGKVDANGNMIAPDESEVDGDGGYYSVPSWEFTETTENGKTTNSWHLPAGEQARIWWGEGIFVQTAAVSAGETLRFYRPDATGIAESGSSGSAMRRFYTVGIDIEEELTEKLEIGVRQRTVIVRGLTGGEHISIYDMAGRFIGSTIAVENQDSWTFDLPEPGIYIITADGRSTKLTAR